MLAVINIILVSSSLSSEKKELSAHVKRAKTGGSTKCYYEVPAETYEWSTWFGFVSLSTGVVEPAVTWDA